MRVVIAGSYREAEQKKFGFKGRPELFETFCRKIGRCLAEDRHTLWLAWSDENLSAQLGLKEDEYYPYWETADFHAFLGFVETLVDTPSLCNGPHAPRILFMLAGMRSPEEIKPFQGYETKYPNLALNRLPQSLVTKLHEPGNFGDRGLRSQLLKSQAGHAEAFVVVGGGKATEHALEIAKKRNVLIPFGLFGGSFRQDEGGQRYIKRMPVLEKHIHKIENNFERSAAEFDLKEFAVEDLLRLRHVVLVMTVKEEESRAVQDALTKIGETVPDFQGDNRTYGLFKITAMNGSDFLVATVKLGEQGPIQAGKAGSDGIQDLHPLLIILTGIGGGQPCDDYSLGDVVIGNRLHDFTVGKQKDGGQRSYADQGGAVTPAVGNFIDHDLEVFRIPDWNRCVGNKPTLNIENIEKDPNKTYGNSKFRKKVIDSLKRNFPLGPNKPKFLRRSVVTNSDVITDSAAASEWSEHGARNFGAIEMEFGGVYAAANTIKKQYHTMTIRGISDIVGLKRDEEWTEYACKTAAAMTAAALLNISSRFFEPYE